jgi:hypothetical protein
MNTKDQDTAKGAMETEKHDVPGNIGLQQQLGHRDQDPMIKDADTDFPEPGENPEHTRACTQERIESASSSRFHS